MDGSEKAAHGVDDSAPLLQACALLEYCAAWSLLDGGAGVVLLLSSTELDESLRQKIEDLVRGSIRDLAFWWLDGAAAGDADLLLHNPQALQALETALGQV
ncbi:MAG: hypothetical protein ACI9EF_002344, partial [Pseudohongiellaceae bacterium]